MYAVIFMLSSMKKKKIKIKIPASSHPLANTTMLDFSFLCISIKINFSEPNSYEEKLIHIYMYISWGRWGGGGGGHR